MSSTTTSTLETGRRPTAVVKGRRQAHRGRLTLAALVLPSMVLLVIINAYPIVYACFQALHDGSLINAGPYVGMHNFDIAVHDPAFWRAARFTAIFTVVGVFGSWVVGLAVALIMRAGVPGRNVFKVLLLLPWVAPVVVSATSWSWLVSTSDSPLPRIFRGLGFGNVHFLADPTLAAVTVCVFKVWISFPFMLLMSSAALAAIDPNVYEASYMDGAGPVQQFRTITLPLIARSTYISWILMTIFCVNDFPTVYLLTGGGPVDATTSLPVFAYRLVFQNFQTGYGVAVAFLMTLVMVVVSVFLFRRVRKSAI